MKWSNENTLQDKIFNLMEKLRKYKVYFLIGGVIFLSVLFFFISRITVFKEKYIELIGSETINLYVGDTYKELGYKAYDAENNSYTDEVIVESNLNTDLPGTYEITYNIGKKTAKRTVVVLEKPEIHYEFILKRINDEETIYLGLDSEFEDPGYHVFDSYGNDITESISVEVIGEVDTSVAGTYTLIYEFSGPNNELLTTTRDIVVIDNKLNLSLNKENYTNSDVIINIDVEDEYFDYILMPNDTQVDKKEHSYLVTENGTYKFVLHNKKGLNKEETIEVKNIDKEKPTGNCQSFITNGKTTVQIFANDNIGIKSYEINGKEYTKNEIVLDGETNIINAKIYDKAGNISDISCASTKKSITLSKNINNYTNESIRIIVSVNLDNFNYLKLPNGNITYNKNYVYSVTENGIYTFYAYDKNGTEIMESISVDNIDRVPPTGSCQIKKDSTGTYISINAQDNIGVKNYVYNNKTYTTKEISLTSVPSSATVSIYDKANNVTNISCTTTIPAAVSPTINSITKDGVIITIKATKANANISGYYFSYNNTRPNKTTGGYVATSNTTLDVVRLPGTTYVWVEDKNGNISSSKSITISNDALLITKGTKYTKLEGTKLSTYLTDKGWSIEGLNNLIARSSRAAGLYTKEAAATSAVAFQTVIAQKYKIKIPYWWGGKSWSLGASSNWGMYKKKYSDKNKKYYYYYGLDCSGFTTWAYINAGYKINSNVYPDFWGYKTSTFSKENGEIGDFITTPEGSSRHIKIIIGKTSTAFITAEAAGKGEGMIVNTHAYTNKSGYYIRKGERLMEKYNKIDASEYPSGF